MRVAVEIRPGLEQIALLGEAADDLVGGVGRRKAVEPAVGVVEPPGLVDGREHRQVVDPPELEVLLARAGRDVDDSRPLLQRDLVPGDDSVLDLAAGAELVERAAVREPDELLAENAADEALFGVPGDRDPFAALTHPVLGVGLDRGGDVRRERPGRRRPDHDGLAVPVEQREAHVQRRVAPVLVDARLRQLVLRERGAAARAPLGRAMSEVQPPALVDDPEESPDVLDVRVAEREVVVPPVHPLPQPD